MLEFFWNAIWHTLLNILVAINSVVGVPGISIIIFTIFMRLLMVPLTMKSLRSSRNMQAIQPKIKEIQKQYGKDRAKMQEETMKLYQQYGINPAAGCFPILLQLPIFFGLFSALQFTLQGVGTPQHTTELLRILWIDDWANAANFNSPFLWVPSLAAADPFFIWPVLSGLFQFFQSRMSIPYREPGTPIDPQQQMMNTMLQFMPIMIVLTSAGFPAGTVIYWAFSSLFGAVQQYFITGWGTLPNLPGFKFLPKKVLTPPPLPEAPIGKKGLMQKMMDRALEAQQVQQAAQTAQAGTSDSDRRTSSAGALTANETDGASVVRLSSTGKGNSRSQKKVREARRYVPEAVGGETNGLEASGTAMPGVQLPRKKRSKR